MKVFTFAATGVIFALSLIAQAQEDRVELKIAEDAPPVIRKVIPAVRPPGAAAPAKDEPKKDDEAATEVPRGSGRAPWSQVHPPALAGR